MSKNLGRLMILVAVTTLLVGLLIAGQGLAQNDLTDEELLGEFLYFDENLSEPAGQVVRQLPPSQSWLRGPR